ncbi:MAG: universal stress protein [Nitrospira sp.]
MSVPAAGLRILLATDGSHGSATAEPYAYGLAGSWGAALTVMRVLEFPPGMDPDYAVNRLYGGPAADSILDTARSQLVDLIIIMGTHGRRGLSHTLFGSVAESVLRRSSCPVLTVRSPKFHPGHRRVLSGQSIPTNV